MQLPSKLRILTWHVHGNYLYYLTQVPHEWYVLSKPGRPPGYAGRSGNLPWGPNVHDMPVDDLAHAEFDCVLYQHPHHYAKDRLELLPERLRRLPQVYLEHDPPQEHPTDTVHPVQDPAATIVHVTHFNDLMWDSGVTPTRVVEHGVLVPADIRYSGELHCGIVVLNNARRRGRRLGADIYRQMRKVLPLDLIGMGSSLEEGGLGEVNNVDVPAFIARYRFYFHSCRYSSLGLAACEAMTIGLPIVTLATTEMATVIRNGVNGYMDTNRTALCDAMRELLRDPELAARWGRGARATALERFGIDRFVRDWMQVLAKVTRESSAQRAAA